MSTNRARSRRFSSAVDCSQLFRDLEKHTQTISVLGDDGIAEKAYKDLQEYLCSRKKLYEDPDFDVNKSVEHALGNNPELHELVTGWERPMQICRPPLKPLFYKDGASRFDIVQGALGDCWFLAAVASIAKLEKLAHRVAPPDQGFTTKENYCGLFRFCFWHDGVWKQVLVDDRLPVRGDRLVFTRSSTEDEFWTALLEKAYAKMMGSYAAIEGGFGHEAMKDLTGGFMIYYNDLKAQPNLYQVLFKANQRQSLLMCGTYDRKNPEADLTPGHAYTLTDVQQIKVKSSDKHSEVNLLRIRNPYGNSGEWKGIWSDDSEQWKDVAPEEKMRIGFEKKQDGEFWIDFSSFLRNFDDVDICFLTPGDGGCLSDKMQWDVKQFDGAWKKFVSAGGPPDVPEKFSCNPKFQLTVKDADGDGLGTVFLGLMKKSYRTRTGNAENFQLQLHVYKLDANTSVEKVDSKFFKEKAPTSHKIGSNVMRDISVVLHLQPGKYVVVPCTDQYNRESEFILRIVTEEQNIEIKETNNETRVDKQKSAEVKKRVTDPQPMKFEEKIEHEYLIQLNEDKNVKYCSLKDVLDRKFKSSTNSAEGFDTDFVRSLAILHSKQNSGKLQLDDYPSLMKRLAGFEMAFRTFDANHNGTASLQELQKMLSELGLEVGNKVLQAAAVRFGEENGEISLLNFMTVCMRLTFLCKQFQDIPDKNDFLASAIAF